MSVWKSWGFAAGILCVHSASLRAQTPFVDVRASAGLEVSQHVLVEPLDCLFDDGLGCDQERMTGGAAVGDINGMGSTVGDYDGDGTLTGL